MNSTRFLFRSLSRSSNAAFLKQQRHVIVGSKSFSILKSSTPKKAVSVKVLAT
jgi:hypothetical protein